MPYYNYARPNLTVDIVIVHEPDNFDEDLKILLIRRGGDPYKGSWALPGGFVEENEPLLNAAKRELKEETSISGVELHQIKTYGDPGRDPRGWTASVVFMGRVSEMSAKAGDDAKEAKWFSLRELPEMAFDHNQIIKEIFS